MSRTSVRRKSIALLFLLQLFLAEIAAGSSFVRRYPNPILSRPGHTVENIVLGRSCLSLRTSEMSLSCNPAALSLEEVSHFRANFVFDDNLANVIQTSNKLSKDDTLGFINEISSHEKALSSQGHLNFWYQDEWWAVGATPQRGVLITKASNPAYLEVESTAAIETELFFKAGALLENHRRFSLGIDLRYVFRDFVDKKVDLIEATSDLDLMAIQTGQQLYIEPGLIYSFDSAWKTEISAAITNLDFLIKGEKIRERAIVDLGLSSTPDFLDQKFRSTIHFSTALLSSSMDDVVQCFRWSGLIAVSNNLSATYTLASNEQALGAIGRGDSLILGIGLKNEKSLLNTHQTDHIRSVYFDLGLAF